MALAELAKFYNSFEAGAAQSRLSAEGIESFLFDVNMGWEGMGGVIPIRLMVDEDDLEQAARLLAQPPA
jgi:Putative prokaryotic signal transducing protein